MGASNGKTLRLTGRIAPTSALGNSGEGDTAVASVSARLLLSLSAELIIQAAEISYFLFFPDKIAYIVGFKNRTN